MFITAAITHAENDYHEMKKGRQLIFLTWAYFPDSLDPGGFSDLFWIMMLNVTLLDLKFV